MLKNNSDYEYYVSFKVWCLLNCLRKLMPCLENYWNTICKFVANETIKTTHSIMHFTVMNKLCASGVENFERYQIIKVKYTRGLVGVVAAGACCPGKFNTSMTVVRTAKSFALKSNLPAEKKKLFVSFLPYKNWSMFCILFFLQYTEANCKLDSSSCPKRKWISILRVTTCFRILL